MRPQRECTKARLIPDRMCSILKGSMCLCQSYSVHVNRQLVPLIKVVVKLTEHKCQHTVSIACFYSSVSVT